MHVSKCQGYIDCTVEPAYYIMFNISCLHVAVQLCSYLHMYVHYMCVAIYVIIHFWGLIKLKNLGFLNDKNLENILYT